MFSIGISEILLVVVVGCLVTDPKKMPAVVRAAGSYYRKFEEVRSEVVNFFHRACSPDEDSAEALGISYPKKKIVGNDGKVYEAYEVGEIINNEHVRNQCGSSTNDKDTHKMEAPQSSSEGKIAE
ncbi:twin-arginine translocase subunit [Anaplasma platys]|uniref:Twin-arginine translocase subunit n=1 Tax=Anaplasma platys TaxID=949 RepID=A0A858PYK2_9RICK|nr:twin-arginine translocase TatA/TatE family subunit [Anaplasma platys]QJC27659.1 twin-arginine translocase subunit [Anaplasma platys]